LSLEWIGGGGGGGGGRGERGGLREKNLTTLLGFIEKYDNRYKSVD